MFYHFVFASQLSLGVVFLLSSIPKLHRPISFARSVIEYKVLPPILSFTFGLALIPLEIFLGVAFLTGWLTDVALPVATTVLISFITAVGVNLRRGRNVACGCFGSASEQISARTVARLLVLLSVVLVLAALRSVGRVPLSGLVGIGSMAPETSMPPYLLQTACLSVFLFLLATWCLRLGELKRLFLPLLTNNKKTT